MSGGMESGTTTPHNPWEERWSKGNTGWDQGSAHPELVKLLNSNEGGIGLPKEGRALVPGCGMGYDVLLFAQHGLETIGLDISETGAKTATRWISQQAPQPTAKGEIVCTDFFTYTPDASFDLILDYTFLCALPPDLRRDWAKQITALSSPAARLITIMYPLPASADAPPKIGGPPFELKESDYHDLLDEEWELIWIKRLQKPTRHTGAPGGEALGVWRRR